MGDAEHVVEVIESGYPPSQVHVAAPTLTASYVRRQRCLWCGALLSEVDLRNVSRSLEPGEDPENPKPWEPASWPVGALVRLSGTFPRVGVVVECDEDENGLQIPADSCMALDDAVTGG